MDIVKTLQKQEFRDFYNLSKSIYVYDTDFPYHSAIAVNTTSDSIHSIKFYYGTYKKIQDLSVIEQYLNKEDISYLYNIWDTENLDNKGFSFCIKYYPQKNIFKYQIHCKVVTPLSFKNLTFSNNNCRYGIGIERGDKKNYINLKDSKDKILVSKFFNIPNLVFFDELEYCEFDNYCKVITSYNSNKKYVLRDFLINNYVKNKKKYPSVISTIDCLHENKRLALRNFGIYKDVDLYSLYFYLEKPNGIVDSYEPFLS